MIRITALNCKREEANGNRTNSFGAGGFTRAGKALTLLSKARRTPASGYKEKRKYENKQIGCLRRAGGVAGLRRVRQGQGRRRFG
jgi:hypothetical protein